MSSLSDIADQIEEAYGAEAMSKAAPVDSGSVAHQHSPPGDGGLLVRLVNHRHSNAPAREAHGILPIFVVGHEGMNEDDWKSWVRRTGAGAYGSAYAERCAREGIDLKEMGPTTSFGRVMRVEGPRSAFGRRYLDQALYLMNVVEKWPSLYHVIAHTMRDETMTLRTLVDRVSTLPPPHEVGEGQHSTLGDLIGRGMMLLPDY